VGEELKMGFFFRRSFGFGPFRINLSKSGLGGSFGVRGLRVGVSSKGKKYVRGGMGGLYYYKTLPSSDGQLPPPNALPAANATASSVAGAASQGSSGGAWLDDSNVKLLDSESGDSFTTVAPSSGASRKGFFVVVLLGFLGLVAAILAFVLLTS
jgi:hypothetical protein